jgi:hypothetical protein
MILGIIYVLTILVAPGGLVRGFRQLTDWIAARWAKAKAPEPVSGSEMGQAE